MRRHLAGVLIAGAVLAAAGCGGTSPSSSAPGAGGGEVNPAGDIPDNQAYVAYTPPGGGYSVKVPEGWSRTRSGNAVTFTDKLNFIRMESLSARRAPTVASARRTLLPALARSVKGFTPDSVTVVLRRAGRAVRITYLADAPANAVTSRTNRD